VQRRFVGSIGWIDQHGDTFSGSLAGANWGLQRAGQLRALNRLRAEALATLPLGIDAGERAGPVWSVGPNVR